MLVILCGADLVLKGVVRVEDINPIDEKVDVWSFGVTVYELVTGMSCASQRACSIRLGACLSNSTAGGMVRSFSGQCSCSALHALPR